MYSDVAPSAQSGLFAGGNNAPREARDIHAARKWFDDQVSKAKRGGQFTVRAKLTPALAAYLRENHMPEHSNRRFRRAKAASLAAVMRSGHWDDNTHQGIAFAEDGTVNDGQHRINAVAESGVSVTLPMTFGQPRQTFAVIDQGITPRTASDLLDIAQLKVGTSNTAAAIIRFVCGVRAMDEAGGLRHAMNGVARHDVLEFATAHTEALHRAVLDGEKIARGIKAKVSPSNVGAALYLIREKTSDVRAVDRFVGALADGTNLEKGSPILQCREGLRQSKFGEHIRSHSDRRAYEAGAVILAWNKWRARQVVRGTNALTIREPKEFPEVSR